MLRSTLMKGIGLMVIFAGGMACEKKAIMPVPEELQKQIALGENIFLSNPHLYSRSGYARAGMK